MICRTTGWVASDAIVQRMHILSGYIPYALGNPLLFARSQSYGIYWKEDKVLEQRLTMTGVAW